jgi:choline transport protein
MPELTALSPDAVAMTPGDVPTASECTSLLSDDAELIRLTGHRPVLERNFSLFALLSFSFMVVDSWLGIASALATGISSGGPVSWTTACQPSGPAVLTVSCPVRKALLVYGTILVSIFTMAVAMSLAELAGAYPTSGGSCLLPSAPACCPIADC